MAEESTALENEEEVDVISLLATQSEEVIDEDDDSEEESTDSGVLKERLAKRNKSLKKSKQAVHRIQEENEALQTRLEKLEEKLASNPPSATDTEAKNREQKEALEQWRTEIGDNPEKAVDFSNWQMTNLQDNIVNYIAEMKTAFESEIAELRGATNPDKLKYQEQIDRLKSNPELSGIDDKALMQFIKATSGVKVPRGGVGGQRATVKPEEFKMDDEIRRKMGFEPKG